MQSTGQAGTQSSHPLQSVGDDRVHALARPDDGIGRAGIEAARAADAGRLVDPRDERRRLAAASRIERLRRAAEQGGEFVDQPGAARRAAIQSRFAACERFGVRPAGVVAAAPALGLREQRIDARGKFVRIGGHRGTQLTFMPALAPASGVRRNRPESSEAASAMPSDTPKRSFFGFRLATITTWRPTSWSGS